jgi:hypothetical protein
VVHKQLLGAMSAIGLRLLAWNLLLLTCCMVVVTDAFELFRDFELQQVNHYLDEIVPRYTNFSIDRYHADLNSCGWPMSVFTQCRDRVTRQHIPAATLWTPKRLSDNDPAMENEPRNRRHLPDCEYAFTLSGAAVVTTELKKPTDIFNLMTFVDFTFHVTQTCPRHSTDALGGTTFDMFAYTNQTIATCQTKDNFDNTYEIVCRAPVISFPYSDQPIQAGLPTCLHFTAVLEHEHYDTYSIVLNVSSGSYGNVRQVLVDNVTFCSELSQQVNDIHGGTPSSGITMTTTTTTRTHFNSKIVETTSTSLEGFSETVDTNTFAAATFDYPSGNQGASPIHMYSGIWTVQEPASITEDEKNCSDFLQRFHSMCFQSTPARNIASSAGLSPEAGNQRLPAYAYSLINCFSSHVDYMSLWSLQDTCFNKTFDYLFGYNPVEYFPPDDDAPIVTKSMTLSYQFSFKPYLQRIYNDVSKTTWAVTRYHSTHRLVYDDPAEYMFIGTSHMRYTFLSLLEYLFGRHTVQNYARKMEYCEYQHDERANRMTLRVVPFADDQLSYIKGFCGNLQQAAKKGVLTLAPGGWELNAGISKILRDPNYGPALFTFLKNILEGTESCPGIKHIIIITPVPYPMCSSDKNWYCVSHRLLRTNPAFGAMREYFLERLLNVSVIPSKKLSIVDSFSIIYPRVILNENFNVICENHYSCAVNEYLSPQLVEMAHGPPGMAVVQSLINALTDR